MRTVVGETPAPSNLSREQQLEFLACLVRSDPENWVCEACVELHAVVELDTPTRPWHMSCPRGWASWCRTVYGSQHARLNGRLIDHRHVQLALKYSRMERHSGRRYLQELLAPQHNPNFAAHVYSDGRPHALAIKYSAYPKVAMGADNRLRYLLLSVWHYRRIHEAVSLDTMGSLQICPHLYFSPRRAGRDARSPCEPREGCAEDIAVSAIGSALYAQGSLEVYGGCPRCRTDFSVRASSEFAVLRAWQDLGPECSPIDLAWKSQVVSIRPSRLNIRCCGPIVSHESLSVWRLYYGDSDGASD